MKHLVASFLVLLLSLLQGCESLDLNSGYPLYLFNCSKDGNFTPNSFYQYSLFNLLSNLSTHAASSTSRGFYYSTMGQGPTQVYASYLCRGDVPHSTCSECVSNATKTVVSTCPYQLGAAIWYIECMFQYSNEPYRGVIQDRFSLKMWNSQNMSNGEAAGFAMKLNGTLAASDWVPGRMFATKVAELDGLGGGGKKLYTLAECRPDLSRSDCKGCLRECNGNGTQGKMGGMVVFPSCNIRFEVYQFYMEATMAPAPAPVRPAPVSGSATFVPAEEERRTARSIVITIILIVSSAIVGFLILGMCLYMCQKKLTGALSNGDFQEITTAKSLQFDFNKIRASTNNFSVDRKLGQGGFGAVYKGRLENGQLVAVKRLSTNSMQGIKEFKNEVLLVAKLQHRNLVKLIGFCISEKEKVLVYEFLPNSSLDRFLSDPSKKECLNWATRFKIICGIAKGLLYLHDDSRLKIIHRDLKSSNILLDDIMNPKISDFGLARLFGVDQTQDDTNRIVGTYGYMAPEYAMTGHFSTKSDVYSFGVIILEIVSGQRNRFFSRDPQVEEALLLRAWKLWTEGMHLELVDQSLGDHYSNEEVSNCIHIGLLCIQEDPDKRPKMSSVVASLSGEYNIALPSPVAPNFFPSHSTCASSSSDHGTPYLQGNMLCDGLSFSGTKNITDVNPR